MRKQLRVVLHLVVAFVIMILLAQLWLFTVTLEAMENREASAEVAVAALICSLVGMAAVWSLIRFFLRAEDNVHSGLAKLPARQKHSLFHFQTQTAGSTPSEQSGLRRGSS